MRRKTELGDWHITIIQSVLMIQFFISIGRSKSAPGGQTKPAHLSFCARENFMGFHSGER